MLNVALMFLPVGELADAGGTLGRIIYESSTTAKKFKSLGAAYAGSKFAKALQTGGHILNKATLKALNLSKEEGKIAIESLKKDLGLPSEFHATIMGNGDFVDPHTKEVLGNLYDYLH